MKNVPAKTDGNLPIQHEYTSMLERLATDPNCDVGKLEKMMDLQERVLNRDAEQAYNADMVAVQAEIRPVVANQRNEQTKSDYGDLKAVVQSAKPIYTNGGFALSFYQGETEKEDHIRTCVDVMHRQGHTKVRFIDLHIDMLGIAGKKNKTKIHGEGSTFSYARRYLTCMVFHIPTGDDDDGNTAGGVQYISEDQQSKITDLLLAIYGDDHTAFLGHIKCESVGKIPAKDFTKHLNGLKAIYKKRPKK